MLDDVPNLFWCIGYTERLVDAARRHDRTGDRQADRVHGRSRLHPRLPAPGWRAGRRSRRGTCRPGTCCATRTPAPVGHQAARGWCARTTGPMPSTSIMDRIGERMTFGRVAAAAHGLISSSPVSRALLVPATITCVKRQLVRWCETGFVGLGVGWGCEGVGPALPDDVDPGARQGFGWRVGDRGHPGAGAVVQVSGPGLACDESRWQKVAEGASRSSRLQAQRNRRSAFARLAG